MNKCEVLHPQQLTIKGDVVMSPKGHKWAGWPIMYKSIMLCLIKNDVLLHRLQLFFLKSMLILNLMPATRLLTGTTKDWESCGILQKHW